MGCAGCGGGRGGGVYPPATPGSNSGQLYRHTKMDGSTRDYLTRAEADAARSAEGGSVQPVTVHRR